VKRHLVRERALGDGAGPMGNRGWLIPRGCLRCSGTVENIVDLGEQH
jgi:hypothetical protein